MYDYVKQQRWAKLRVGIVITIAVGIVLLAILFAGNIEKIFAPKSSIYAPLPTLKDCGKERRYGFPA
jgi:hypothetical protein